MPYTARGKFYVEGGKGRTTNRLMEEHGLWVFENEGCGEGNILTQERGGGEEDD